ERRVGTPCCAPCLDYALGILRMQRNAPAATDHLIRREARELLKVDVTENTVASCIDHEQAERRGLADCAQACFALAQRAHAFTPVRDINEGAGYAVDLALRVQGRVGKDLDPAGQAIAADQTRRMARGVDLTA